MTSPFFIGNALLGGGQGTSMTMAVQNWLTDGPRDNNGEQVIYGGNRGQNITNMFKMTESQTKPNNKQEV